MYWAISDHSILVNRAVYYGQGRASMKSFSPDHGVPDAQVVFNNDIRAPGMATIGPSHSVLPKTVQIVTLSLLLPSLVLHNRVPTYKCMV